MDQKMSILFFILFAFENFFLTTTQHHSSNYDVTETLQDAIRGILQTVDSATTQNFLDQSEKWVINSTYNLKLENIHVTFNKTEFCDIMTPPSIYKNFITDETHITVDSYRRWEKGTIRHPVTPELVYNFAYFPSELVYNATIKIIESSKNNSKEKFSIDFPSNLIIGNDSVYLYRRGNNSVYLFGPSKPLYKTVEYDKFALKKSVEPILLQNMRRKFVELSKNISNSLKHHSREIFTSSYPNLFEKPERYLNLIPNISYFCFNLRNITITGLTNFVSLIKTDKNIDDFEITLLIENIRGELILDYGSEIEKPIKLGFLANDIFIRANPSNHRCNVEIKNYRVIRTGSNVSLTDQQSTVIIQHIESALASSLMPSMKMVSTKNQSTVSHDMQSLAGEMVFKMVNNADWQWMKHSLHEWIPFNEDQTNGIDRASTPKIFSNQKTAYQYNIQFQNLTIKLISGNPNPKEIQCEFPNSLKLIHDINAAPIQKIRWNSNTGNGIDISFQANFTSINFSHIIPNNSSTSNNCCEFQLENDENIKIELEPEKNTNENQDLKFKKKIDKTLISMAKERFFRSFKQTVCLPFKVCTQATKIVDNFFLHFIENVLKKCSLRTNKNTQ